MNKSIREWARVVYEQAKRNGFHASEEDVTLREKVGTFAMNLHAEISELWEAFRKGQLFELCDKAEKMKAMGLRPLTCIEEELADIHIRNMDMAEDFKKIGRAHV